jgi:hypothetical protein
VVAKTVYVKYTGTTKEELQKKFSSHNYEFILGQNEEIIIKLHFENKKKLSNNSSFLKIEGAEVNILNKKLQSPPSWIDNINYKTFFSEDNYIYNIEDNFVNFIIKNEYQLICNRLFHSLNKLKTTIASESLFANVFFSDFVAFKLKNNNVKLKIITLDGRINEQVAGKETSFRCDLVYILDSSLHIVEYKFRNDREGMGEEGLRAILFRKYPNRIYSYIKNNMPEDLDSLKDVFLFGLGLNKNNIISLSVAELLIDSISNEDYKDNKDFLIGMKLNKRRFVKTFK